MVTFKKAIGSVSVSGHKFVGAPVPCGIVITRMRYIKALSSNVEYLNSRDATIMGSRNGHAPIFMWYTLTCKGYEGMRKDVEKCLRNAHLLKVGCPLWALPGCQAARVSQGNGIAQMLSQYPGIATMAIIISVQRIS